MPILKATNVSYAAPVSLKRSLSNTAAQHNSSPSCSNNKIAGMQFGDILNGRMNEYFSISAGYIAGNGLAGVKKGIQEFISDSAVPAVIQSSTLLSFICKSVR